MKKYFLLIVPLLFLLSGCAIFSSNITFTPVDGLKEMKLSSRTIPAKISKESDKTLETKGYAYIGFARSEDVVKTCWEDDCRNFTCSDKLPHRDTTKEVLDEAAAHGGDVVILQKDATLSTDSTTKQGKCIGWRDRDIQVSYCCEHRSGYCQRTCFRTQTVRDCTNHENIYGKKCSFITSGTVWRLDPELAGKQAKYMAIKNTYEKNYEYKKEKSNLLAWFKDGDKYGFKDKSGSVVIKPQFTNVHTDGWSEGLIAAALGEKDKQKYGYIDKTGRWVISPSYEWAGRFSEGLAVVTVDKKYMYIDKTGKIIMRPQFTTAGEFHEGLAQISVVIPSALSKDASLAEVVQAAMDSVRCGYIDKTGSIIIEPQYRWCVHFSEGLASVKKLNEKYGYIDRTGRFIIKPQFDGASGFVGGIAKVKVGNKEGYINKAGEVFMKP